MLSPNVHVYRGTNIRYAVFVRASGCRKFQIVGAWGRSYGAAARRLADAMSSGSRWKRGGVAMISDYYDPVFLLEMRRP